MPRRLPAPWKVIELEEAFVVEDAEGHRISATYWRPEHQLNAMPYALTKDEARRVARNIARLPEFLQRKR